MAADTVLYLNRSDVERVDLGMPAIIEALESMFLEKGRGRVEMPPKPGIHTSPDAFIHAMPAWIPSLEAAGVKWISGYPGNQARGLPYINGLLILNDPETGIPTAVMDATWITAQRTGAATAVAARRLARPESESAGIIACGVQGRSNLEALSCLFDLKAVRAYDIHREVAEAFAESMSEKLGLDVEVVEEPRQAVTGADLVVTSGPIREEPEPVIDAGWLAPGAFASPVDFDAYWTGPAFAEADKLVTDDLGQFDYYRRQGYFRDTPEPQADLGQIAAGLKPAREREDERAIAINLGIALEDMATAIVVYRRAVEMGIGTPLPL